LISHGGFECRTRRVPTSPSFGIRQKHVSVRFMLLPATMPQTLKSKAKRMLSARFGHPDFKKGQWQPIESVLGGNDALVVMPTGSGKSIVYQLPALMLPGLTVVVSPLIALMKDQQ